MIPASKSAEVGGGGGGGPLVETEFQQYYQYFEYSLNYLN